MTQLFHHRVILVSGAAQGIGLATSTLFARQGATVLMLDRHAQRLDESVSSLRSAGHAVEAVVADVRDGAAIQHACKALLQAHGDIDVLVHAAGVLHPNALLSASEQEWSDTFDVNAKGLFHLCQGVCPQMMARKKGCVITVASNAATTPRIGMGIYAASKAASTQLTRCLGLELAAHGIRCNTVSPGSTDTEMQRQLWHTPDAASRVIQGDLAQHRLGIPLQRIASAEDVARAVCFLASDDARHITLHDLRVDGGATLDA